jgi:hypothetical protein
MSNDLELLARAYVDQVQELDAAATDLLDAVALDGAEGVQLDGLGQIIGLERQGLSDELYKSLLRAYIRVNNAAGTIEDINAVVRFATNTTSSDQAFSLTEGLTAEFLVVMNQILGAGIGGIAAEAMYQAKAAGVHGVFEYWETEPIFTFDGDGLSKFDGGFYLKTAIRNRGARESEIL